MGKDRSKGFHKWYFFPRISSLALLRGVVNNEANIQMNSTNKQMNLIQIVITKLKPKNENDQERN